MGARKSTARSRDIGGDLAVIREKAGFDGIRLTEKLDWDQSKVSRIEHGKQAIGDIELITWLTFCGITGARLHELVDANHEATKDTWLQPYGKDSDRTFIAEERRATKLVTYQSTLIPGLLQTKAYMRALLRDGEAGVERRLARQDVLRGEGALTATFFIDEAALRRVVGGHRLMHDQLMHLLVMADWKKVTIRVVPLEAGAHAGVDGPFDMFDDQLVCIFLKVANVFLENPDHVAAFKDSIKDLDTLAMSEEQSRAYIAQMADEFSRPREDHDDSPGDVA